jgi:hypothetical protein
LISIIVSLQCNADDIIVVWKQIKHAKFYDVTCITESGLSTFQTVETIEYLIENALPGKKYIITVQARDNSTNKSEISVPLIAEIPKTNIIVKLNQPKPTFKIK